MGILSKSKPRLLTSWNFREVPPGTNGGVSLVGTLAGFLGAFLIALTSVLLLPFCDGAEGQGERPSILGLRNQGRAGWTWQEKVMLVFAITVWGGLGSVLDSALGGWFQASVIDTRTGKVIEGSGGKKVSLPTNHAVRRLTRIRYFLLVHERPRAKRMTSRAGALKADLESLIIIQSICLWPS